MFHPCPSREETDHPAENCQEDIDYAGNLMADEVKAGEATHRQPGAYPAGSGPDAEERLAASLPLDERDQPDPELELSYGRTGPGGITLIAVVAAAILAVVFYGLNSPAPEGQHAGSPPGAAAPPQGGGTPAAPNPQPSNTANGGKG